ncbi:hypothetical protein [Rhizobium sp. MHM7A]|uniref:hypothetical protein n=1 Tax=Rhizobium sp. MHM7A TaxID=2583233 RepID=UPI00110621F4|nr:hypothetical protein [Rhizobium sp. MHM7A]TLX17162.1 hypothetical protein FFR93_07585 [Rhizobium sp. MHM7A]
MENVACTNYIVSLAKQFAGVSNTQETPIKRTVPMPKRPKKGCTAICRADANGNIPGNLKDGVPLFTFGEATAANCPMAVKEAKRKATHALGMQPKHIGCETAGK